MVVVSMLEFVVVKGAWAKVSKSAAVNARARSLSLSLPHPPLQVSAFIGLLFNAYVGHLTTKLLRLLALYPRERIEQIISGHVEQLEQQAGVRFY